MSINKNNIYYFSFFLTIMLTGFLVIYLYISSEQKQYNTQELKNFDKSYKSIINTYSLLSENIFNEIINKKDILSILDRANGSINDEKLLNIERKKLLEKLKPTYRRLKALNLRQLHFHLKNGNSFLRMHKELKFGDNLYSVRESIRLCHKNRIATEGFEEGRIYNGFRYVFPIFYEGKFLGSVESSVSFKAISKELFKLFKRSYGFILDKSVVNSKLFNDELSNYVTCSISNRYLNDKFILNNFNKFNTLPRSLIKKINKNLNKDREFQRLLDTKESFAYNLNLYGDKYLVLFKAINNFKNRKIAYIISYSKTTNHYDNLFIIMLLIHTLLSSILFYLYFLNKKMRLTLLKLENYKNNLEIILERRTKKIKEREIFLQDLIDSNRDIIITTNKFKIEYINKAFNSFFGSLTPKKIFFSDEYIQKVEFRDRVYSMKLIMKDTHSFLKMLVKYKNSNIKVHILLNEQKYMFLVKISPLSKYKKMIVMSDITYNEIELDSLKKKIKIDHLTKLNNRLSLSSYLEKVFEKEIEYEELYLVIFDIDYFKNVNDTYGHNVGDSVLVELSYLVKNSIRESDFIARYGGEEFILVFLDIKNRAISDIVNSIRINIENHKFSGVDQITCSFGISKLVEDDNMITLIKRADNALYRAKNMGRNRVEFL